MYFVGIHGWCCGESTRLPLVWTVVEFVFVFFYPEPKSSQDKGLRFYILLKNQCIFRRNLERIGTFPGCLSRRRSLSSSRNLSLGRIDCVTRPKSVCAELLGALKCSVGKQIFLPSMPVSLSAKRRLSFIHQRLLSY